MRLSAKIASCDHRMIAAFGAAVLFGAALTLAFMPPALAQGMGMQSPGMGMQSMEMMHLQDQLRDCRGDACVPVRDQMMSQLRDQLQNCSGASCDQLRERLRLHEQVQDCHLTSRGCRELRMQERDQVRPQYHFGYDRMNRGMGRGMDGGMGN